MPDELFHVEMVNLKPFAARLRGARPVVEQELLTATDRLVKYGEREAKRIVRVKRGGLRRSITSTKAVMRGGVAEGRYGTNKSYAKAIEKGRKAITANPARNKTIVIRPKNAAALRFVIGGRVIFSKKAVVHQTAALRFVVGGRVLYRKSVGPAKAYPFMRPSFQLVKQRAPQEYRMAMSRIIQRIGGGR